MSKHHHGMVRADVPVQGIVEDPVGDEKVAPVDEPAVPVVPPCRFRVLAEKCISVMGNMTWLHKDDVIEAAGYGTDGIARLIEQGVQLQPVE